MKSYLKFCVVVGFLLIIYGVVAPWLISGGTEMFFAGVVLMVITPLGVVSLYRKNREVKDA